MHLVGNYPPAEFRKHFRVNRETFDFLLNEFRRSLINRIFGRKCIDPKLQLFITLWFFANCNSYREIVSRFHVGLATAIRAVRRLVFALFGARDRFIQWPDNPLDNCRSFEDLYGFPKVVGCIDGTHINIPLYYQGQH